MPDVRGPMCVARSWAAATHTGYVAILRKRAAQFFIAIGLICCIVTATPLVPWYAGLLAGEWNNPRDGVLIVLAGSTVGEGVIGYSSYWRAVYAVQAWRQGAFEEIVVSGGPQGGTAAGAPLRAFMVAEGVPASLIQLEAQSGSTRENALYTKDFLRNQPARKALLTSDFHMFRGVARVSEGGINGVAVSHTGRGEARIDLGGSLAGVPRPGGGNYQDWLLLGARMDLTPSSIG